MIPFIIIFIFLMLFLFLFLRIREKFQSKKPIYDVEVYGKDFPQCVVNCSKFNDLDTPKLNNADTKKKMIVGLVMGVTQKFVMNVNINV